MATTALSTAAGPMVTGARDVRPWGWGAPAADDEEVSIIHELAYDECEQLLRASVFGRVVLNRPTGPEVLPVNYTVSADAVLVRTAPGTLLDRHGHGAPLVFEVDNVDYTRWHGWSVVARGVGQRVDAADLTDDELRAPPPPPWVRREEVVWIRLRWVTLTGRRVGSGWSPLAELPVRRVP